MEQLAFSLRQNIRIPQQIAVEAYDDICKRTVQVMADAQSIERMTGVAASRAIISGQNSIMALNAAISRTGNPGSGCTLIVEEMNKLAEEAIRTVKRMHSLIMLMQLYINTLEGISNELLELNNYAACKDHDIFVKVNGQFKEDSTSLRNSIINIGNNLHEVLYAKNELNMVVERVMTIIGSCLRGVN